jgi:hypothetical protein
MRRGESWWLSIGLSLLNPYVAAEKGYTDYVIKPAETRPKLITALEATPRTKFWSIGFEAMRLIASSAIILPLFTFKRFIDKFC